MKKLICTLAAFFMLVAMSCAVFGKSGDLGVDAGQTMPDFTVSMTDGSTVTLSGILKEKKLVVLNVFATWCGPCEAEFPEFEKVYQTHNDEMEIISVSGDPDDTMEMVAKYKDGHSLSFPMGLAGDALDFLKVTGYPTTVFIDHDGKVGYIRVGAFVEEGDFEKKVNTFLSDDYNGEPLASDIASSSSLYMILTLIPVAVLLLVIGRWLLFRKAGETGWHSIIPLLSTYKEYMISWSGMAGLLAILCQVGTVALAIITGRLHANWMIICTGLLGLGCLVFRLVESIKLAKAFGKGAGAGILLAIFQNIGRFILGVSKAQYRKN